jgi:hypothetical protein
MLATTGEGLLVGIGLIGGYAVGTYVINPLIEEDVNAIVDALWDALHPQDNLTYTASGNHRHDHILGQARELVQAGRARDICDALDQLYAAARCAGNSEEANKIKQTQKAMGCRGSRHGR